ncbi:MAG TPA: hypothetical protein VIM11_18705 [Tepidisphaeraceae bacterium]|jgi:hypothetical protein
MSPDAPGANPHAVLAATAAVLEYRPTSLHIPPSGTRPIFGWGLVIFPPAVAMICWPALFAVFFVMSFTLALMAITGCLFWAWSVSYRLASWCYWKRVRAASAGDGVQPSLKRRTYFQLTLFAGQTVGILSSCPVFWFVLQVASRHGYRPQAWWLGWRLL